MTYFGLFTVMFSPAKNNILLICFRCYNGSFAPARWVDDWKYRFLFSFIKQTRKFFDLLPVCYSLFIRWGHEYDPGDFSAFKLSSLVFSKKYYAHGYQHENDISYFNFLLAHTASSPGGSPLCAFLLFKLYFNCCFFSIYFRMSS